MRLHSVRMKVITVIIIALTIGISSLTFVNYFKAKQIIEQNVEDAALTLAENSGKMFGLWFDERRSYLRTIASMPDILLEGNNDVIVPYLNSINENSSKGDFESYFYADKEGNCIDSLGNMSQIKGTSYFAKVINEGAFVVCDPIVSKDSNEVVITLAYPIKKGDEIVGVIGSNAWGSKLIKRLTAIKVGETGCAFIIKNDGTTIFAPNESEIDTTIDSASEKVVKGEVGVIQTNIESIEYYLSYAPVNKTNWMLLTKAPVSEFTLKLRTLGINNLISGLFVSIIIILFLGIMLTKMVIHPIKKTTSLLKDIAEGEGDLTKRLEVKSNDEIGELSRYFNHFVEKLHFIVKEVKRNADMLPQNSYSLASTAEETSASINEVSRAIEELAMGASTQAKEASQGSERIAAFGNEIVVIKQAVQNAKTYYDHVNELSQEGLNTFNALSDKFGQSTETNKQVTAHVEQLTEKSISINQIVNAIQSVADQTNLLALNAAIEAARAGEAGRGFAVVADEIRKLAEQTAVSTKEIESIINEIQAEISITKDNVDQSNIIANENQAAVKETTEGFNKISQAIGKTSNEMDCLIQSIDCVDTEKKAILENIQGIVVIAEEAAASTEEVSASVEEQAATVETMANTAEELKQIAELLKEEMDKFKI